MNVFVSVANVFVNANAADYYHCTHTKFHKSDLLGINQVFHGHS